MINLVKAINRLSDTLADIVDDDSIQNFVRRSLDVVIDTSIRAGVLVLLVSFCLNVGPAIESRFLGVFDKWAADNYEYQGDNAWTFDVYATNPWYRFNCLYITEQTVNASIITLDNSTPSISGTIHILKSEVEMLPNENRYKGKWQLVSDYPVPPNSVITGVLHHKCHVLWSTTTVFGPFQITVN